MMVWFGTDAPLARHVFQKVAHAGVQQVGAATGSGHDLKRRTRAQPHVHRDPAALMPTDITP